MHVGRMGFFPGELCNGVLIAANAKCPSVEPLDSSFVDMVPNLVQTHPCTVAVIFAGKDYVKRPQH